MIDGGGGRLRQDVRMRFGVLGTGHWAAKTQGLALSAHPEAELVGVWGRDPDKADQVAGELGTRPYADLDALLADIDAVAIAVPPDVQADLAVRAAQAGRHLVLDKPLALSLDAADRVVAAVEGSGVAAIVFFTNRFYSNVDEFLRDARGRSWHAARIAMFASIFQGSSPYKDSPWRREYGALWDIGPHALSIVVPVLGAVERIAAMPGPYQTSHLMLGHASGAVSSLALSLAVPPASVASESVLYGIEGTVPVPRGNGTSVEAFGTAVSQLIAMVRTGATTHPCDVRFGREVVEILQRAEAVA